MLFQKNYYGVAARGRHCGERRADVQVDPRPACLLSSPPKAPKEGNPNPPPMPPPGSAPPPGFPQCQDHGTEQTPLTCSSKSLGTLKESSTTSTSLSPSAGRPIILVRKHPDWYFKIYIRRDRSGSYHTYPDVSGPNPDMSGPFTSIEEAENAIDCYLGGLEDKMMCKDSLDKLSPMEWLIQRSLYWPDGKKRKYSEAFASENTRTGTGHLLQALVDKYNEDHNLLGDLAYELKDVLHHQTMCACESNIWYYHFNFTTTTKGADGIEKLFFAEVTRMVQNELVISCFCMINPDANGPCYGCKNDGNVDMKHPNDAKIYNAGHTDGYLQFEHSPLWDPSDDDDDDVKDDEDRLIFEDEEARLRFIFKGLDDPETLKEIFTSPYATAMCIEE